MGKCLWAPILLMLVSFTLPGTAWAQPNLSPEDPYYPSVKNRPIPRTPDGKPDLSGFWADWFRVEGLPTAVGRGATERRQEIEARFPAPKLEPMALTAWAAERQLYNQDPLYHEGKRVRNELDPRSHCFPIGVPRLGAPFQILPTTGKIFIVHEQNHEVRQIFTDGRSHPLDLEFTWSGHSIGHWDGDTLVVDTVGLRDETHLDGAGHVHGTELRVQERIRRIAYDVLEIESILTDPQAFEKPHKTHRTYVLAPPDWHLMEDIICNERYQRGVWFGEGPSGF